MAPFNTMKGSDYIATYIEHRGVTHVFELIGGMITFLVDSLHNRTSVQIVSMHHEQGAAFAAEGYGRMLGLPGVAMATSGPGATNLLTAIGSCYFDSVPTVFITGQVNRSEQRGERPIRQLGFQETDIVSMAGPITKAAWLVQEPADLPRLLHEAFALAVSGRPGPVLIDVPMDIQRAEVAEGLFPTAAMSYRPTGTAEASARRTSFWRDCTFALAEAKRPLILAGGGLNSGRAVTEFTALVDALRLPVASSLMGIDVLPASHPLRIGLLGSYGNRWVNTALAESDCLLVLGSRLDVRQTGADVAAFMRERKVYHVDCEPGELNNRVKGCETLVWQLKDFLAYAITCAHAMPHPEWLARIAAMKAQWPDTGEQAVPSGINPNVLMHELSRRSTAAAAYVADVGQHQMWAAQSLDPAIGQRFITSGGMGAMGSALPLAIGACFASGRRPVVVVAGDGGFQLNIQELQTIVRNRLPIKIMVLNNNCHGMVRQFQEAYFKGRYQSTLWGYNAPDFAAVAAAYRMRSDRLEHVADLAAKLDWLWRDPSEPSLLEVIIATNVNAYPKMAFGRPMSEMEPRAKPIDMEGT
jgi:acetolactate synthase-1/2/3 large subunit